LTARGKMLLPDLTFIDVRTVLSVFIQSKPSIAFARETAVCVLANTVWTHVRKQNTFVSWICKQQQTGNCKLNDLITMETICLTKPLIQPSGIVQPYSAGTVNSNW